jgi:hypothetical protein
MSLTLIIIINAIFDVAILGALAFVMSRAARLEPHLHFVPAATAPPVRHTAQWPRPRVAGVQTQRHRRGPLTSS